MAKKRGICTLGGCGKPHFGRGWCRMHYKRWYKHGDPLWQTRPSNAEVLRFLHGTALLWKSDECCLWPFTKMIGYGRVNYQGKRWQAHRLVCYLYHGLPESQPLHAAHSCGDRGCVNPSHLRWATPKENESDKLLHGRHGRGTRCSSAKLTETDVIKIRSMLDGADINELAKLFRINQATIRDIKKRRTWAWLE